MFPYTMLPGGAVRRGDGLFVPPDPANADYADFLSWLRDGGTAETEAPPPSPRVVSGAAFLGLFTAAEVAALWAADPRLMAGAMKVMAQDSCNLDSAECAALMQLAASKGALTPERAAAILSNQPPTG